jgi:hypothetical protein
VAFVPERKVGRTEKIQMPTGNAQQRVWFFAQLSPEIRSVLTLSGINTFMQYAVDKS